MSSNVADPLRVRAELTGPGGEFEIVEEDVLGVRLPVFARRPRNLGELLAAAPAPEDRDYLVTADRRIGYGEHAGAVGALARVLAQRYGVGRGDRVAILAANCPEWIVAFWATVSLGAVCATYNAWWTTREIEYALGHSEPVLLIADAERAARLPAGIDVPVLGIEGDLPGLTADPAPLPTVDVGEDEPAAIVYTSGTTGRPKGVTHSHRNIVATALYHRLMKATAAALDPRAAAPGRWLLSLPLFHIASLHNVAVPRLATGETVVLTQGAFDPHRVLELVSRERVTNWTVVPTMGHRLSALGDEIGRYDLSALIAFGLASAPSSPALQARLRELIPAARHSLVNSYGLTESGTGATVAAPMMLAADPDTVGVPIPTVAVQVRDESGAVVPDGVTGEIWLRSQFNMLGYWADPAATAEVFDADRWLRTGDLGCLREGRLYLTTRRSDLILRGGENVYPVEVERCLAEHPAVAEAAVFGVEHPDLGQEVCAIVVTGGQVVDEADLRAHTAERLAYYKVPSRWHLTTEPLPRNATGKVVRTALASLHPELP
ncbi:class I adenylate-forming enzyme family protein [Prauserella shujinwangii]|nr:class I adenylate-forming enzyme family protein [Prauserella shujinwangii]